MTPNLNTTNMRIIATLLVSFLIFSCSNKTEKATENTPKVWSEIEQLELNSSHESPRMRYKLIQSKYRPNSDAWKNIYPETNRFTEKDYTRLKPYIYEKNIPTIQKYVKTGLLTYEELVKWYIHRIIKTESNPKTSLNAVIALSKNAILEARKMDKERGSNDHPIYGMPILLKDNVNATGGPTTAGAILLAKNQTRDAKIVENLKQNGAIILGKANLSEWAYYFCDGCPLGYSAIGGQTLNPYGRFIFETGGSSAGSGAVMAANYAAAAVGTETAGSILSPSSQNSIVGLKPTVGLLSRTGIVPISSTLDTPGPMTRSVVDNAILLSAMTGKDDDDPVTAFAPDGIDYLSELNNVKIQDLKLGVNATYFEQDPLYKRTVEMLIEKGAEIFRFTPEEISLSGFVDILNYDMQRDLPAYLESQTGKAIGRMSVGEIIEYNNIDSTLRAPYGQGRFIATRDDTTSDQAMDSIKSRLETVTRDYFNLQFDAHDLDAILSINNYDAAYAAAAKYPCLAMPMGYTDKGEPKAMTFIGRRFQEKRLLQIGSAFEKTFNFRKVATGY